MILFYQYIFLGHPVQQVICKWSGWFWLTGLLQIGESITSTLVLDNSMIFNLLKYFAEYYWKIDTFEKCDTNCMGKHYWPPCFQLIIIISFKGKYHYQYQWSCYNYQCVLVIHDICQIYSAIKLRQKKCTSQHLIIRDKVRKLFKMGLNIFYLDLEKITK